MKIIFEFFISHWDKVIPIIISVIALILSIATWIAQRNFAKKYSKQTDVVISNSILLALYDINLLIHKVEHVDGISFDKDQLTFQLESLRSNLKLVNSMKLDQLPSYSMLNFQTYLKDLREVLYKLESDVRKFDYELEKCNDKEKYRNETRIRMSFLNMDQSKHGIQEIGCAYSENLLSRKKNMNLSPAKTIDMYRENFYLEPWKIYVTNWTNDAVFYDMNFKYKRALLRPYLIDYSGQIYFGRRKIVSTQEINNPFPQP